MTAAELRAKGAITAKEGCAFLRCSLTTWKKLEREHRLPTFRLPALTRSVRYDGPTLAAFGTADDMRVRASKVLRRPTSSHAA